MRHRTTDPACRYHRPIRGLFARWRDRRSRGRQCDACRTEIARSYLAAAIENATHLSRGERAALIARFATPRRL